MGIPYTKTPEDIQIEVADLRNNKTLKHLKDLSAYKFSVGDILIREDSNYQKEWQVHVAACGLPYKYIYAFENELGIGYIRRLSIHGDRFVERPICTVEFDPERTRFRIDPEYADHLMLANEGEKLDLVSNFKETKKKREKMNRQNDKIREDTADARAWLATIKVGDKLWCGWGRGSVGKDPLTVLNVNIDPVNIDACFLQLAPTTPNYYGHKYDPERLMNMWWYKTRPLFFDELL